MARPKKKIKITAERQIITLEAESETDSTEKQTLSLIKKPVVQEVSYITQEPESSSSILRYGIKWAAIAVAAAGVLLYSFALGFHYIFSNNESHYNHLHTVTRCYGIFMGYKELSHYRLNNNAQDELTIDEGLLGKITKATDGGSDGPYDGLVDKITIQKKNFYEELFRSRDYATRQADFDRMSEELKEIIEKNKHLIPNL